jgi:hypothetical protein
MGHKINFVSIFVLNLISKKMKKIYLLLLLFVASLSIAQGNIVISQFYGGNSATGPYNQDFVELFNRTTSSVDVSGWTIQYGSAAGNFTIAYTFPASSSIAAGKYFLVGLAATTGGISLPTVDATAGTNLSGTAGKLALVKNNTALGSNNPSGDVNVSDYLGYGTGNFFEGTSAVSGITALLAGIRNNNGCSDTNQNGTDFIAASPSPKNSATASYSCTAPSFSVLSPSNNQTFSPETTSLSITLAFNNFNVANGTGNGNIRYNVNSGTVITKYDTTPISLTSLTPGVYTVFIELVNNSQVPLTPAVNTTLTFSIASYNVVANLAAVRADVVTNGANKYYQVNSAPVITYARSSRNQKYIQDSTGGILIDDLAGTITTTMTNGDAIGGLKGQATLFSSLLQFVPSTNATVASSGNVVSPQVVTIADLNAAAANGTYESELVQINNVTFDITTANFPTTAANININTGTDIIVFRTLFTEANYMNTVKPTTATNIIALVGKSGTVAQVTSRNLLDINVPLSASSFSQIDGLKMYPNPAKNNLFIETALNSDINVSIINVLGKEVINSKVSNNAVNISGLTPGMYIVKITEEGNTSTKKLIIE